MNSNKINFFQSKKKKFEFKNKYITNFIKGFLIQSNILTYAFIFLDLTKFKNI
jgi:hypothetical protein